jgi:hypothetical protein
MGCAAGCKTGVDDWLHRTGTTLKYWVCNYVREHKSTLKSSCLYILTQLTNGNEEADVEWLTNGITELMNLPMSTQLRVHVVISRYTACRRFVFDISDTMSTMTANFPVQHILPKPAEKPS